MCQAPADALQDLRPPLDAPGGAEPSVHAIIPTYGRSRYVASLLSDLADQTLVPKGVFVIHQERREGDDDLDELREALASREWPYEVELLLNERVGACRARNLGLGRVDAEWILLLDDDVRLRPRFVEHLHRVARAYGIEAVVGAVHLEEEADQLPQDFVMPWSTFGTGTSMVSREVAERAGPFDETLETGWGEDFEWGVRLRLSGGSVGYTTGEPTLHLKAPSGGFRSLPSHPWEEDRGVRPRPSPTMVHSRYKHATPEMRTGFRLYSWLAQLRERPPWWWPVEGIRALRRVRSAERWARRLQSGSGEGR